MLKSSRDIVNFDDKLGEMLYLLRKRKQKFKSGGILIFGSYHIINIIFRKSDVGDGSPFYFELVKPHWRVFFVNNLR